MARQIFSKFSVTSKIIISIFFVLFLFCSVAVFVLSSIVQRENTNAFVSSVISLSRSLEKGVKNSLERGQMTNFKKLVEKQKEIEGIIEVALYDKDGRLNLSSNGEEVKGRQLEETLYARVLEAKERIEKRSEKTIQIVLPQIADADCIRCHPTWILGEVGGILSLTCDATPLNRMIKSRWTLLGAGSVLLIFAIAAVLFLVIRFIVIKPINNMIKDLAETSAEVAVETGRDAGVHGRSGSTSAGSTLFDTMNLGGRKDEIGKMQAAVEIFKENAIARYRLESEQERAKQHTDEEKRLLMEKMADHFESSVGGVIEMVSSVAKELQTLAQAMSSNASRTNSQSSAAAISSEHASANVQNVAQATDELSKSIDSINQLATKSAGTAQEAVQKAGQTNETVGGLVNVAREIDAIVEVITDIAGHTKLLALNANIEAARVGEQGKGFAVVANEVKELAKQTAEAANEIRDQISDVQIATQESVVAIQIIVETISEINQIALEIAAAVQQQDLTTKEIARNTQEAAAETQEVSANIGMVAHTAGETGGAAGKVLETTDNLLRQAGILQEEMLKFLSHIRTD